ncbi:hypothetical protein ACHQM5_012312 [Ranunculus cassubicifolius]
MPGLPQRNVQFTNGYSTTCSTGSVVEANGIWSKHRDDVSFDQLQKFWSELSASNRQTLLRIDKQTLLEQARKNLYCSRCNGLLLEGFSQIVMYGKSLQQDGAPAGHVANGKMATLSNQIESGPNSKTLVCQNDTQDPSVHPWGGLIATREGILTLLDCFVEAESLDGLQNVFDSARVREREREVLYPDACGGGGRGWISQGAPNYGRGHGTRETCALHTARLSCDTLVDFWSALGDETRRSLLRMKEEDFIERLMYRFDSKRFCRDCRRNVIREFKELKELKRMRREPRCTSWFCVADTAFQYEVSDDMVLADWHQSFSDTFGTYHHFEWAVGTGEGKSDILEFEDVGMNGSVQVNGLDLGDLNACFITLRAWKLDGRCTELSVKAHAMKGQACVHRRLVVGDGYVTITKGESIRRFFEHAEEAEEEEDDESMDKDGNEMDGEGSRPQKHAKSPELAREFLLDAATVIFKEQVEKAFREGTARQNAHCIFVCLALKLLEDRIHVACKEIITLEKQTKLLEEEEREKRHEEERKERRRTKEREKKLRRKERLKGKERQREEDSCCSDLKENENDNLICEEEVSKEVSCVQEESNISVSSEDSVSETCEHEVATPDTQEDEQHACNASDSEASTKDGNGSFIIEQSKSSRRKLRYQTECNGGGSPLVDEYETRSHGPSKCVNGVSRQYRNNFVKSNPRSSNGSYNYRPRCDLQSYNCSSDYQAKDDNVRHYRNSKYYMQDGCGGGVIKSKKVWEPKSVDIHQKSSMIEENTNPKDNGDDEKNVNPKDNSMSSSDNCSSCLSEGDSSTASSVIQNGESWSTSDSEDAGQHVEDDKDNKVNGVKLVTTSTSIESSSCPTPVAVDIGPGLSPQQHRMVPPMYNVPMIPAPSTMAYYHQNPASWSAAPVNGLSPYAQPNRYLFSTPIGYGPSHLCMQYSQLQPVPIHPVYQSVNRPTTVVNANPSPNPEEHNTNPKVPPVQNGHGQQGQGLGQNQTKPQAATTKIRGGNTDFSLFHFGGPIAGCGATEEGPVKNYNSFLNCDSNNKDATMEEYSLFAASNRTRFSFF